MLFAKIQHLAPRRLRTCLALLMMVFVLGTVAHAGHVHAQQDQVAHHQLCDYCAGFAHVGGAPANTIALVIKLFFDEAPITEGARVPYAITHTSAQARAPPR